MSHEEESMLDLTRIADDVYRYTNSEDQIAILLELEAAQYHDIESFSGIVIVRHNDDGCGESWIEIQVVDSELLKF